MDDINDLFQLRALLEGYSAARAADRITLIQLNKLRESIKKMDEVLASNAPEDKKVEDFLIHNNCPHFHLAGGR